MYRKAETLLAALAPTIAEPAAVHGLTWQTADRRLGWLLHTTGRDDEAAVDLPPGTRGPGVAGRRPRGDGRVPPRSGGRRSTRVSPLCWMATGKSAEAEAECRKALAIQQKLAERKPRRHPIPQSTWRCTATRASRLLLWRRASHRKRRPNDPQGAGDPAETGRRQPRRHPISAATWRSSHRSLGVLSGG